MLAIVAPLTLTSCQPVTVRLRVFIQPTLAQKHSRLPKVWRNDRVRP